MLSIRYAISVSVLVTLAACGGGGASGGGTTPPPPTTNQSVGGIWTTQYTVTSGSNTGDVIVAEGIASETGQYFAYSKNTTNGCAGLAFGQLSVNGNNVSGNEDAAIVRYSTAVGGATNCVYPDGSTSATGTIIGTVSQRASLMLTASGTTSLGGALPADSTTFTFSSLYLNASSLATIAGNYNDGGPTMTVDANGAIFEQDPNGCVLSGQVSIINPAYNAYGIQLTFANCTGTSAGLNGVVASGLVMLDTSTSPATVIGGITGNISGQLFVEAFNLPRM
ncbi:MAG TPA: hypothetical protein VIY68_09550 [Steroidobacteraceae bacterium]